MKAMIFNAAAFIVLSSMLITFLKVTFYGKGK